MPTPAPVVHLARRAVIYTRQSAYREESISLASQEHIARTYCEQRGYTVTAVHSDGVSGRAWATRPGVIKTLEAIEQHAADVVDVWKWSRLSRNRMHWAIAADRVDTAGGRIESATEPINTETAAGRFNRGVMLEMAQFESDRIGEQWTEVHEYRRRQGLPPTGGPRFGYQRDENGNYHPDPTLGPVLADMYRMYLSGKGAAYITRILNQRGIPRGDKPWNYQSVMQVLDSGFGAGILVKTRQRGEKQWERPWVPGAHDGVISMDTWEAYRAARRKRAGTKQPAARRYLLVGMIRCTDCGGAMSGYTDAGITMYRCSRATQTYNPDLRRVHVRASIVDRAVEEWLFQLAEEIDADPATHETRISELDAAATFERRSLERRLERAEQRIRTLTLRLADDTIPPDVYKTATAECHDEIDTCKARLAELAPNPVQRDAVKDLPHDLRALWPSLTIEQRANVLRPVLARAEVRPVGRGGKIKRRVRIVPTWED